MPALLLVLVSLLSELELIKHLSTSDTELLKMKRVLETLELSNDEKVQRDVSRSSGGSKRCNWTTVFLQEQRIKELEVSLHKCKEEELVKGQTVFKLLICLLTTMCCCDYIR